MDARRLSETKAVLKKRPSMDRSAPLVEDAAHPGSASVLRAISAGHFELKHAEDGNDRSAPAIEPETKVKKSPAAAVFAEVESGVGAEKLKSPPRINDRSAPVIEKWPTDITTKVGPRKALMTELEEKKDTIESFNESRRLHAASTIAETKVRPDLMAEVKSYSNFIEEKNEFRRKTSVEAIAKEDAQQVLHSALVAEVQQKRASIEDFGEYAARHQPDSYRSQVHTSLVNEIREKRDSIDALTTLHNHHTAVA